MGYRGVKILMAIICQAVLVPGIFAQNTFKVIISDSATGEMIVGAAVMFKSTGASQHATGTLTDTAGFAEIKDVPDGEQAFTFSYLGHRKETLTLHFPVATTGPYKMKMVQLKGKPNNDFYLRGARREK